MNYLNKTFGSGDWEGRCISETQCEDELLLGFLRLSFHHKSWSVEFFSEEDFLELNMPEIDYFSEHPKISEISCYIGH